MGCTTSMPNENKPKTSSLLNQSSMPSQSKPSKTTSTSPVTNPFLMSEEIKICVKTEGLVMIGESWKSNFYIDAVYSKQETLGNILTKICKHVNNKYKPIQLGIYEVSGFTKYIGKDELDSVRSKSIVDYNKNDIISEGLRVTVKVEFEHKVIDTVITCEHMKKNKTNNPTECPIYYAVKQKYEFSTDNLHHLNNYQHFNNEFAAKPPCNFGQSCNAYVRCEAGKNRLDDTCHMKIYRHPPRGRNIKLAENIHSLVINQHKTQNKPIYTPTNFDKQKCSFRSNNGYVMALIEEVIQNGFRSDLCLECGPADHCTHKIYYVADDNDEKSESDKLFALVEEIIEKERVAEYQYSILNIVDEKLAHHRHKAMNSPLTRGQMLALVLYTGCECNYDLCKTQRNGNYGKWKWFDYCLYTAIALLSNNESGSFLVYSGLNKVKLDEKMVPTGYFVTYVSSSWRNDVARSFMNGDGMLVQIDKAFKNHKHIWCCDVSWISRFQDECEILFARSIDEVYMSGFSCAVLDESNGVQTVSLKRI